MTRLMLRRPFPEYQNRFRRRARNGLRLYSSVGRRHFFGHGRIVEAYWWDGTPNFGDALTPWLLPRYGVTPVHVPAENAVLIGVGSILEHLPVSFDGSVWGSGLMYGEPVDLPRAHFAAVRGELTREVLGLAASTPLGDPGLLVGRHLARARPRWELGVVAHHAHVGDPDVVRIARLPGATTIDVTRGPHHVVRRISACATILSTSLHGLVTADAYGIPAVWAMGDPELWGGDFKFRDHETVARPARDRRVDLGSVRSMRDVRSAAQAIGAGGREAVCDGLEAALRTVPTRSGIPALAWRYRARVTGEPR